MPRFLPALVVAAMSIFLVIFPTQAAPQQQATQTITVNPGDTVLLSCATTFSGSFTATGVTATCADAAATATATPTATATATASPTATSTSVPPPTATTAPTATPHAHAGLCGESMATWHPPVVNGCETKHEHGDQPPTWVQNSTYKPMFDHPANTPNENVIKHTSFKGFTARLNNVDLYVIMHLDTNPSGHNSRFHSYQMWARENNGQVSYWDGWQDFGEGDSAGPTIRRIGCEDTSVRPIMSVNDEPCGVIQFESWYPRAAGHDGNGPWMPDFGFNTSANYFTGGDPTDPSTWVPTGGQNNNRRIEIAWYANRSSQRGTFYATNFGEVVSGPDAPVCGTTRTIGGRTYPVLCVEQRISPSLTQVSFPNNAVQKTYPFTGVVNPN